MSTSPTPQPSSLEETDKLLHKFEIDNIPAQYREYYGIKRNNLFASIQRFRDQWAYYMRLDAIWMREFEDLKLVRDEARMFPLALYLNAHAKIRVAIELAFSGCMAEARSILRDAIEFLAHSHAMIHKPELQKVWLSKNHDSDAFKNAFERDKQQGVFKGLDELYKKWGELSEMGSHATINAVVGRLEQVMSDNHIEHWLTYTGLKDSEMWAKELFSMLLTCATMEQTFFNDYESRLKLDNDLMRMRGEFDRYKEQLRQVLIARYKVPPPSGIYPPPKPKLYRP
jgi:hypothetical protein